MDRGRSSPGLPLVWDEGVSESLLLCRTQSRSKRYLHSHSDHPLDQGE